jgi:hypothetical protein
MADVMDTFTKAMRMQYGLLLGGVKGMAGMARLSETFLTKLAEETKLSDNDDLSDILDKTPNGCVEASRQVISELRDLPQEMMDSYRSVCKEEEEG